MAYRPFKSVIFTSACLSTIKNLIYSKDSAVNLDSDEDTKVLPSSSLQFTSVEL